MKKIKLTKKQREDIANRFVLSTCLCFIGAILWFLVLKGIFKYTLLVDTIIKSKILAALLFASAVLFAYRAVKFNKPYNAIYSGGLFVLLLCILTVIIYKTNTLYAIYIGFVYIFIAFIAQIIYFSLKYKGTIK